jgi:hypothetical protein
MKKVSRKGAGDAKEVCQEIERFMLLEWFGSRFCAFTGNFPELTVD